MNIPLKEFEASLKARLGLPINDPVKLPVEEQTIATAAKVQSAAVKEAIEFKNLLYETRQKAVAEAKQTANNNLRATRGGLTLLFSIVNGNPVINEDEPVRGRSSGTYSLSK